MRKLDSFGLRIYEQINGQWHLLLSPAYQEILGTWADEHDLHTQDIENLHAALRAGLSPEAAFHSMVAQGALKQAQRAADACLEEVAAASEPPSAEQPEPEPQRKPACKVPKSINSWFFNRCRKRDSLLGLNRGRVSKQLHALYDDEWDGLSPEQQQVMWEEFEADRCLAKARVQALADQPCQQLVPAPPEAQTLVERREHLDYAFWSNGGTPDFHRTPCGGTVPVAEVVMKERMADAPPSVMEKRWKAETPMLACDKHVIPEKFKSTLKIAPPPPSAFGTALLKTLKTAIKQAGGAEAARGLEILLVVEVEHWAPVCLSPDRTTCGIGLVVASYGAGAAGSLVASSIVLPLEHAEGASQDELSVIIGINGLVGLDLRFARDIYVQPYVINESMFTKDVDLGRLKFEILEDWVAGLANGDNDVTRVQVSSYHIRWSEEQLDVLTLGGRKQLPVELLRSQVAARAARAQTQRAKLNSSRKADADFDWLAAPPAPPVPPLIENDFDWLAHPAGGPKLLDNDLDDPGEVVVFSDDKEANIFCLESELARLIEQERPTLDPDIALANAFAEDELLHDELAEADDFVADAFDASDSGDSVEPEVKAAAGAAGVVLAARPVENMMVDSDLHLFEKDPRVLRADDVLEMETISGKIFQKDTRTGLRGRLLGQAKMVGMNSVRIYCRLHGDNCRAILYGARDWERCDKAIDDFFLTGACYKLKVPCLKKKYVCKYACMDACIYVKCSAGSWWEPVAASASHHALAATAAQALCGAQPPPAQLPNAGRGRGSREAAAAAQPAPAQLAGGGRGRGGRGRGGRAARHRA